MSKEKVFISSTIYDFKDLRSALQYYLEEKGFEVVLSEINLFTDNKKNSYEACLSAIESCNYFILLVGGRTGGKYKYQKNNGVTEQITITRAEYRRAYELFSQNKIVLLNFVRQEIFTVKADREGLRNVIKKQFTDDKIIKEISDHESKIIDNDAGEIFKFLDEISKKVEMKNANECDNCDYPKGNWIYQFNSFKDIINVLNKVLKKEKLNEQD